ncbi:hypothetical protein ACS0TY_015710 [Phlomoides rotata]
MAAYAAVVSLMTTVDNIQNHPLHSFSVDNKQIESLENILGFLLDFIESYNSRRGSKEDEVLESRITSAAHLAEDVIESHIVDQIHAGSTAGRGGRGSISLLDLEAVIKDMNSVKETVMEFQVTKEFTDLLLPSCSAPSNSSNGKDVMVGFDAELIQIMDRLTGHQPNLHIVPIVGMGGIGNARVYVTLLIKLFVAEGFLKPNKTQSLEEIADDYLNDLVNRNLILVESRRWKGTIKYLRMHDLVREVCLRIGEKEKFFYKVRVIDNPPDISRERRLVFNHLKRDWPQVFDALPTASLVRTFRSHKVPLPYNCRLLRVLSYVDFESMEVMLQQVNLRYITFSSCFLNPEKLHSKLPSSVSLLWNLQTLIMNGERIDAPVEIWYMRQLRHLRIYEVFLPDPPSSNKVDQQDDLLLPNLQTLSRVMNFSFAEEVCKRIPVLTKLRIRYDDFSRECQEKSYYYLNNLINLLKLESLHCSFFRQPKRDDLLQSLMFPRSLRKLSLRFCYLHWDDLNTYGFSLPHLEVLKLNKGAVVGLEWDCVEEAFPSLRFLKICDANLMKWTAEDSDFPKLEKLHLQNLKKLEKIPSGVGDIQTLQYIHLHQCSQSATVSSTEILEEQRSLGNDYLQVKVFSKRA